MQAAKELCSTSLKRLPSLLTLKMLCASGTFFKVYNAIPTPDTIYDTTVAKAAPETSI